jgi:Fe-S-cluster containining protein
MEKEKKCPREECGAEQSFDAAGPEIMKSVRFVASDDTFDFHCSRCGECCREVKDSVMLETLDIFRLARRFGRSGGKIRSLEDVVREYAHPMMLSRDIAFPIFLLNTAGEDNACIFLKDSRCTVQDAKPRACRMYPLSAEPKNGGNGFNFCIVSQKPRHFTGPAVRAGDWMDKNFSEEDRRFAAADIRSVRELVPILRELKTSGIAENRILAPLLFFKYINYNTDEPFLPQFVRNAAALRNELNGIPRRARR